MAHTALSGGLLALAFVLAASPSCEVVSWSRPTGEPSGAKPPITNDGPLAPTKSLPKTRGHATPGESDIPSAPVAPEREEPMVAERRPLPNLAETEAARVEPVPFAGPLLLAFGDPTLPMSELQGSVDQSIEGGHSIADAADTLAQASCIADTRQADCPQLACHSTYANSRGKFGAVTAAENLRRPARTAERAAETSMGILMGQGAARFATFNLGEDAVGTSHGPPAMRRDPFDVAPLLRKRPEARQGERRIVGLISRGEAGELVAILALGEGPQDPEGVLSPAVIPGAFVWVTGDAAVVAIAQGPELHQTQFARSIHDEIVAGASAAEAIERVKPAMPLAAHPLVAIVTPKEHLFMPAHSAPWLVRDLRRRVAPDNEPRNTNE